MTALAVAAGFAALLSGQADAQAQSQSGTPYLDPVWVEAMVRVESGRNEAAYSSDPMQVNKAGDWDDVKSLFGLTKGVAPGAELSIEASLQLLKAKGHRFDANGRPIGFLGWEEATRRYNGGGDPQYLEKVKQAYEDIKNGR